MKIFNFKWNNNIKKQTTNSATFSHLNEHQKKEVLRKGAEDFSKYFGKSFEKLAKE